LLRKAPEVVFTKETPASLEVNSYQSLATYLPTYQEVNPYWRKVFEFAWLERATQAVEGSSLYLFSSALLPSPSLIRNTTFAILYGKQTF